MNDLASEIVGTTEAAKMLGVNQSRVRQFLLEGRLRGVKISGSWMLHLSEVRQFAKKPRLTGSPGHTRH